MTYARSSDSLRVVPTSQHRAKIAYIYVRQSSMYQVTHHAESTDLQYSLVDRAVSLGWPRERVQVIDEDLGKSGVSVEQRTGFQHLIAEISLAHVGLVLSFDASRLARNNRDWYQLLELCALFGALIADGERLYDPRTYHDRLLLGLSGMISEAELHYLKQRLQSGAQHKAERGELRLALPVGLLRLATDEVILHPDQEIQARIRLVFEQFREVRSIRGVMRALRSAQLPLPSRPLRGPAPHEVVWEPARTSAVQGIIQNPAYAGAYVYGRKMRDLTRHTPQHPYSGIVCQPLDQWTICLQDVYPAYISWPEYLANQAQLHANQNRYRADRPGVARKGAALLQGIVRCGRCGSRLFLHYSGAQSQFPVYLCADDQRKAGGKRCQEVRAIALDAQVEQLVLEALQPDHIALALATLEQVECEEASLQKQWTLRLERARYEAERAERQFAAVEPEHRLVARTLEQRWEERLRAVEAVQREADHWRRTRLAVVTAADRQAILALGQDLPALWHAPSTTNADRKQMLRLVIREVLVDGRRARGRVWFQVNWQTGAYSEAWYIRGVIRYAEHADCERIQQRIRELSGAYCMDDEIAARLNAEGFQTARRRPFTSKLVWLLRSKWAIRTTKLNNGTRPSPSQWEDGSYSVDGAAAALGVFPGTIYHWLKVGRLTGQQVAKGMPWQVLLSADESSRLHEHLRRARRSKRGAL
jgi:DNA invertase Pin-like site-specific DNA recombinase